MGLFVIDSIRMIYSYSVAWLGSGLLAAKVLGSLGVPTCVLSNGQFVYP